LPRASQEVTPDRTANTARMSTHALARAAFVETPDGKRAYYALPEGGGPFPAVLVFQEAFGVNAYVQSEVRRVAGAGYAAIAPDLFHGETLGYDEMDRVMAKLRELTDEAMLAQVEAALTFLSGQPEIDDEPRGAVGFCMGGRLAVLAAIAFGDTLGAAVSFYGGNIAPDQQRLFVPLAERIGEATAPILMLYGADDTSISPGEIGRVTQALAERKARFAVSVYPDAGHGFASADRVTAYRQAVAESAWDETLAFFERYLQD
jgi:carboxymethylenebutenolidase